MRKLILLCLMLFGFSLHAAEEKTTTKIGPVEKQVLTIDDSYPEEFKNQKILIQDKDGKSAGEFDRTKWRIVPRDKKVVYRQTKTIESTKTCDEKKSSAQPAYTPMFKRHTVGLGLGFGKTGLETTAPENESLEVKQKDGTVFGLQYTYHWDEEVSFSGFATSNKTFLAFANYSFNL